MIRKIFIVLCALFLLFIGLSLYERFKPRYYEENYYDRNTEGSIRRHSEKITKISDLDEKAGNDTNAEEYLNFNEILNANDFDNIDADLRSALQRYRVHTYAVSWPDAALACWQEGGRLATPGDEAEARLLGRLLQFTVANANITSTDMVDAMHIGITYRATGYSWTTTEGNSLSYEDWLLDNVLCSAAYNSFWAGCATVLTNGAFGRGKCSEKLIYACDMQQLKQENITIIDDGYRTVSNIETFVFKFHKSPLPWVDAAKVCKGEEATLAVPVTVATKNFTDWVFAQDGLASSARSGGVFVGLNDIVVDQEWRGSNGNYPQYSRLWLHGNPKYNRVKNCAVILPSVLYDDVPCNETKPFVCQKKDIHPHKETVQYQEIEGFGTYAVHTVKKSWWEAVLICRSENATLAIPDSKREAEVLTEMFNNTSKVEAFDSNWILVGVHDSDQDKVWRTIEGKRMYQSGFNEWVEKDGRYGELYCGALRYGKLDSVYCSSQLMFICEKSL